jgi:tellurite resistance protein TerC
MYIFGAFLIYSGIHMLFEKKDEDKSFNPNNNIVIRIFRKIVPVTEHNEHAHFFVKQDGKWFATTFFLTLLFIEVSDVIFAVDSIPAVLSVSTDTFIVFTSNIFAILGLRSLYFALSGIMKYFSYLSYALCGILSFIGIKMCVNELSKDLGYHFHISNFASLAVIIGLLTIAILLSVRKKKNEWKNE